MHLVTQFLLYYADKFFELTVAEAEIDFEIELGRGVIPPSFLFSIPRNLLALADIIFAASITCLQSVADPKPIRIIWLQILSSSPNAFGTCPPVAVLLQTAPRLIQIFGNRSSNCFASMPLMYMLIIPEIMSYAPRLKTLWQDASKGMQTDLGLKSYMMAMIVGFKSSEKNA